MDCVNCGAPLAPKSNVCRFCGTLNDTDLRALQQKARKGPASDHLCPRCNIAMQTMDLGLEGGLLIERCAKCLGIFFDPGELESVIESSMSPVYRIDHDRMAVLIEEEGRVESQVRYVKCPVCHQLMNRTNYGARSGVVVDRCRNHGIWLDGGELGRILKWARAGGRIHDRMKRKEERRKEQQREKLQKIDAERSVWNPTPGMRDQEIGMPGLLGALFSLLG